MLELTKIGKPLSATTFMTLVEKSMCKISINVGIKANIELLPYEGVKFNTALFFL